jgi:hypothetical protein
MSRRKLSKADFAALNKGGPVGTVAHDSRSRVEVIPGRLLARAPLPVPACGCGCAQALTRTVPRMRL